MSNIYAKARARFPFWNAFGIRLQSGIQDIDRSTKGVEVPKLNVDRLHAGKSHVGSFTIKVKVEIVHSLLGAFISKRPEHDCDIFWPILHCMQKQSARYQSHIFDLLL